MSVHVSDFNWEKGKNDLKYIELLEKTLKNQQAVTAKAVSKVRELSGKLKEIDHILVNKDGDVFELLEKIEEIVNS